MDFYKIEFKQSAERDIRKISPVLIPNILGRIEALAINPFSRQSLKLSGAESTYRLRVGNYRIIYFVDSEIKTIVIHHIRHRREVYRRFQ